jgi:hypothetical protein
LYTKPGCRSLLGQKCKKVAAATADLEYAVGTSQREERAEPLQTLRIHPDLKVHDSATA